MRRWKMNGPEMKAANGLVSGDNTNWIDSHWLEVAMNS